MIVMEMIEFAYEPKTMFKANEKFFHGREPTLRRMPDGSLISFVYSGGKVEPDPEGNLAALIRSYDDGETWSSPEIVFLHSQRSVWGTEIFTETDRPFAVFQTFLYDTRFRELRSFMAYTDDSGKTWDKPFTVKGVPPNFAVRQGKVLSNGSWLFPVYWVEQRGDWNQLLDVEFTYKHPRDVDWFYISAVIISNDHGKSFSLHGYVNNDVQTAWEPEVVELENGHLMMWIRTNDGVLWESESFDYGITWSSMKPGKIPNPGTKVVVYKVRDRYVMINNTCAPDNKNRKTLEIWVSDDYCKTWRIKLPLAKILEGSPYPSVCYPHGFADDKKETLYVSIDSVKAFFMVKIPYSDLMQ